MFAWLSRFFLPFALCATAVPCAARRGAASAGVPARAVASAAARPATAAEPSLRLGRRSRWRELDCAVGTAPVDMVLPLVTPRDRRRTVRCPTRLRRAFSLPLGADGLYAKVYQLVVAVKFGDGAPARRSGMPVLARLDEGRHGR